jgi:hypothetical protein
LDGGVGGGVLPHSAKYQALSLRASRGHDQQSGSLPHYQSAGELKQYHHPLDEVSQQPPVPFHQHHDQQHGSSAHQYYNYFEGDSESGDNSHTSLPWAPGLPQHVCVPFFISLLSAAVGPFISSHLAALCHQPNEQERGGRRAVSLGRFAVHPGLCRHLAGSLSLRSLILVGPWFVFFF